MAKEALSFGLDLAAPFWEPGRAEELSAWGKSLGSEHPWVQCRAALPAAHRHFCCLIWHYFFPSGGRRVAVGDPLIIFCRSIHCCRRHLEHYKCIFSWQSPQLCITFRKTSAVIPSSYLSYSKLHVRKKQSCS